MTIRLTIDGQSCEVEKGVTILTAARDNQIKIPTLCDCPGLPSRGSCRMCVVEIENSPSTPTACTTLAEDGMVIQSHSSKIQTMRRELMQMLLADHPSSCLFCSENSHCDECMVTLRKTGITTGCRSCPKDGQCELQVMVKELGLTQTDYPTRYRSLNVEKFDPFFDRNYNLCILCGRCIRACESLNFASAINYTKRGADTVIGTAFNVTHLEAGCTFCGTCVELCPTGALTEKTRKWEGVPNKETTTTCPFCSIGCSINLLARNGVVIGSLPNRQTGCDALCVLGRFGMPEVLNGSARLKRPQIATNHHRMSVSWDEAIQEAAKLLSTGSQNQVEMVVSSNLSNEDLYVAQKFCQEALHSENIHSPALDSYSDKLDIVSDLFRQSRPLSIIEESNAVVCLGFDGRYAQSVVEVELHRAKLRGAAILTVNTNDHIPGEFADGWLQPTPGDEAKLVEKLVQCKSNPSQTPGYPDLAIEQAVRILTEAANPVFIIGQSFLDQPGRELLEAIQKLVNVYEGQAILLPGSENLGVALSMGLSPAKISPSKVVYVIGEAIPTDISEGATILYQNMYLSSSGRNPDLVLPAAAFSEEDGTTIDYAGVLRQISKVVEPPGEALPTWRILSEIAQNMGVKGFEYKNVTEIQAEITRKFGNFKINEKVEWVRQPEFEPAPFSVIKQHCSKIPIYMGFPLTQRIAGLNSLYPGEVHV